MVVFKKDGTPYRLQRPNQIMSQQSQWEDNDCILHNFKYSLSIEEPVLSPRLPVVKKVIELPPMEPIKVPKIEPTPIIEPPIVIPETPDKNKSKFRTAQKSTLYCLPAKITKYKDEVYDEVTAKLTYEQPFKFQAVIIDSSEVTFRIWTTVKLVTEMSILFDPDYIRWWKVSRISNDLSGDGFIMVCYPSDLQPSFEQT